MTTGELFTALGFVVGACVLWLAARERRMATDGIGHVVVIGMFCGAVGAKVSQLVASGWPVKVSFLAGLNPAAGGRALLGGVLFGWLGVEIAKRRLGIKRSTGDLFALALPAGEAVGRIGCYCNGCCFGIKCDLPWAIEQQGALRHPTQIYSAVTAAMLFGVLLALRRRLAHEGDLFRLYLLGFGASRFVIEFFRQQDAVLLGLSPMQWFCLDLVAYSLVAFALATRRRKGAPSGATP